MVVEAAVATVALVAVALVLAWLLGLLGAQLAVGEAARAGARVAARGEPSSAVAAEARRLVPDAVVDLRPEGDHLVVDVRRPVALPGLLARWGPVVLQAGAVSLREPS
ncbi:MAG: hypothetical protein GC157_04070 [Frankiales bacterium]|nr:hypothetical protein [Frankiales bacterium]